MDDEYVKRVYSLEELKEVVNSLIDDYYKDVIKVILFGSYARNEARPSSDIDLMVIGNDAFRGIKTVGFMSELKEKLGKSVDLFVERNIDKESNFYKNIIKEGIVLYE